MSAAFTPGPWSECKGGDCTCGFIWSACENVHVASAFGPDDLGHDWYGSDMACGREQQVANARLIAAAPDLLEALVQCRSVLGTARHDIADETAKRVLTRKIEVANAAIFKARGEA